MAGRAFVESPYLHLDLPQRFDYGTTVPLAVAVDSPMTEADHVRSRGAAGNPFPEVASSLHAANGRASASTRIRLNEGKQEVVAVAELSDGRAWLSRRTIEVAISGCSTETGVAVGYVMPRPEPRLKLPAEARRDEIVEIRTMISTGWRPACIDAAGNPIPAASSTEWSVSTTASDLCRRPDPGDCRERLPELSHDRARVRRSHLHLARGWRRRVPRQPFLTVI